MNHKLVFLPAFVFIAALPASASAFRLASPHEAVAIEVSSDPDLSYVVSFKGAPLLGKARIGLLVDGADIGAGTVTTGGARLSRKAETIARRGYATALPADYSEAVLPLKSGSTPYRLEMRAFEDGLAWRIIVPGSGVRTIGGEPSGFRIPGNSELWCTTPDVSYEGQYRHGPVVGLKPNEQLMPPVVFRTVDGKAFGAITEANLANYCGMRLRHQGGGLLAPDFHDEKNFKVKGDIITPWRVIMLGTDLNALVNNPLIPALSPAPDPALAAAKWITPSRLGWSWMAGGGAPGVNLENMKRYAKACADLGFEGNLVDEGWNHWGGGGEKSWDMIRDLAATSNALGVKTWLWKSCPDRRGISGLYDPKARGEFLARCEKLGVGGVKIDFLNSEDTRNVAFMNDTVREAARHKLMVIFHGCNKPTGLDRTFPNEVSREGVRGQEYGVNATLDQRHPFGRLLAGHADYSPFWCDPADRVAHGAAGTRAHNLATLITYTSEVMLPCEHPEKIRDMPEAEFFKSVPLLWDETRVLPMSEFGRCAAFARRRGGSWFVGITCDKEPMPLKLPLSFLGKGRWLAEIHADSPEARNESAASTPPVSSADTLDADMSSFGGWCARFSKISLNHFGGRLAPGGKILATTADPAAVVRYTLDGSEPTNASPRFPADGLAITNPCELRVKILSGDGAGASLVHVFRPPGK